MLRLDADKAAFPRMLCIFAHPDDETLALGGRLDRMTGARLLTVTDGAPKDGKDARDHGFGSLEAYREARKGELLAALQCAGLDKAFAAAFPVPITDQEVCLHLGEAVRAIVAQIEAFAPEVILTHAYEGGHPDHDGCAFAVHAAVRLFAMRQGVELPLIEAAFYHAGTDGSFETGGYVQHATELETVQFALTTGQQERKRAMLACFQSQQQTLGQFALEQESYREAPRYDFSARPHAGSLLYEQFPWGMQGERFCALAVAASRELCGSDALATPNGTRAKTA